jgi:PadR family transcriptional regulator PadR
MTSASAARALRRNVASAHMARHHGLTQTLCISTMQCVVPCIAQYKGTAEETVDGGVDSFSSWVTQLRKGVVELLVLRLLRARGPLHGYAIARDLQEIGETVAGESTVYPVLKRLEAEGLVEGSWSTEGDTPPRKYYVVTAAGDAFVVKAAAQWRALEDAMRVLELEA